MTSLFELHYHKNYSLGTTVHTWWFWPGSHGQGNLYVKSRRIHNQNYTFSKIKWNKFTFYVLTSSCFLLFLEDKYLRASKFEQDFMMSFILNFSYGVRRVPFCLSAPSHLPESLIFQFWQHQYRPLTQAGEFLIFLPFPLAFSGFNLLTLYGWFQSLRPKIHPRLSTFSVLA